MIKAKGIYRDPVRSSHGHFVKASGLRWLSLMLLAPVPWAGRIWALPFLTVLAPSERYYQSKKRKHKKLTEWARQVILQVRHWLPKRLLVEVADSSFAVIELLFRLRELKNPVAMIVRFRLDAALYEPAKNKPHQRGRPRKKGKRLPTLQKVADDQRTHWKRLMRNDSFRGQFTARRVQSQRRSHCRFYRRRLDRGTRADLIFPRKYIQRGTYLAYGYKFRPVLQA